MGDTADSVKLKRIVFVLVDEKVKESIALICHWPGNCFFEFKLHNSNSIYDVSMVASGVVIVAEVLSLQNQKKQVQWIALSLDFLVNGCCYAFAFALFDVAIHFVVALHQWSCH
ncbi:hypothetical protein WN943_007647 [Citrus x changshan-huyou]